MNEWMNKTNQVGVGLLLVVREATKHSSPMASKKTLLVKKPLDDVDDRWFNLSLLKDDLCYIVLGVVR